MTEHVWLGRDVTDVDPWINQCRVCAQPKWIRTTDGSQILNISECRRDPIMVYAERDDASGAMTGRYLIRVRDEGGLAQLVLDRDCVVSLIELLRRAITDT